ncbi:MAG TPA: hypothetical protein VIM11_03705 [Tepidisphaeraceae bacterium]|jgi:hypothetical protein
MVKHNEHVTNPTIDIGEALAHLMGDTGGIQELMGGFRIRIYHLTGFPWGEVMKQLVYRDFKVYVTRHNADLFIDATV